MKGPEVAMTTCVATFLESMDPSVQAFWGQQKSAVDSGQLDKIRTSELINHFLVFTNTVCSVWWEVPLTSPISCSIYEEIFS